MKKILALIMALAMVLAGCAAPVEEAVVEEAASEEVAAEEVVAEEAEEGIDWDSMTDEELYEMAKAEGGVINVYAGSSKMMKTGEAFKEKYPELEVEVYDLDQDEATAKIKTEYETGNVSADVLHAKDTAGEIYYDYMPGGYIESYYPADLCANIDPELLKYGLAFYGSMNLWYYNTKAFPDGCPLDNWWDIVAMNEDGTPKWNLFTKNLGSETAYLALLGSFTLHPEEMAAAYEEYYGEPITYTYDGAAVGVEDGNAGYEFIYRLSQHPAMTFIDDGDEVVQAIHFLYEESGENGLAFASASKMDNAEDGYNIAWVTDIAPYTAMANCNYMYVISGCDNPAGARLFIRYQMSADGFGESFDRLGNWSVDKTYVSEENPFTLAEFAEHEYGCITPDMENLYKIFLDVQDSWILWYDQNPNK